LIGSIVFALDHRKAFWNIMRQSVKFFHTVSSCGLLGALIAYILVLWKAPQASAGQYADMRDVISLICRYLLVPSLALSLVTGLVAMIVHRQYQQKRWAWAKAALGLSMFESTLAVTQSKAHEAAEFAAQIAQGQDTEHAAILLAQAIASEWTVLFAILALCLAQTALGIWRPKLEFKRSEA
jgi:NADH:ubiquinone oxidoreductase subunit H